MAAKVKPAAGKGPKKGIGGRMPVKRSINLVLVDENKINPVKAILGVILIVALAFVFSKYLVADRLIAMSQATGRVEQLQKTLDDTLAVIEEYGEVEATYAHYTYDGMTAAETSLVDRTEVVNLISNIIKEQDNLFDMKAYSPRLKLLLEDLSSGNNPYLSLVDFRRNVATLGAEIVAYREQVLSWNVQGNVLQVELTGKTLENLNKLARKVEESPIVDTCSLTTANKDSKARALTSLESGVRGKFMIYLMQPVEEEVAQE